MKTIIVISTTVEHKIDAEQLAKLLLKRKLIACAQISGPIISMYDWKGETNESNEFILSVKTTPKGSGAVFAALRDNHPYELPEIVGNETSLVDSHYLKWVYKEVQHG